MNSLSTATVAGGFHGSSLIVENTMYELGTLLCFCLVLTVDLMAGKLLTSHVR